VKRVAFVVQRCGIEVNGGAEQHCLKIAQRMSRHWQTEILTTCALDYMTWNNFYPPGDEYINGVKVRRFKVDSPRNITKFNRLSRKIHSQLNHVSLRKQEKWMRSQGPCSKALTSYVKKHGTEYDAFFFFPYLYATTYFILPLVDDRAYLAPLAHDEWTIYLSMWDSFFKRPKGFIFNTPEEKSFLKKRFPNVLPEGPVAAVGIDPPPSYNTDRLREKFSLNEPFIVYIGRIDPSKGCDQLFEYFINFKNEYHSPLKLLIIGKPVMDIPEHHDIISPGFVDEQTKWDALAASELLVMPSSYESLSMVLLEAWSVGRPVLVNGRCDVLVGQCQRAQGGLWYNDFDEFASAIRIMDEKIQKQLGQQGKEFVTNNYQWPVIERIYFDMLEEKK
jgi:glycosyltransferase involved in cell wall biosynthesis